MSRKLSKKERREVVTKGYYYDTLEEVLDKKLNNYVTKDYLDKRLKEQSQDFRTQLEVLMKHQIHQLQSMFEGLDHRYVLRTEWEASK